MKNLDSEQIVIVSLLLIGWAVWTVWRQLFLPALVVVVGLLLVMAGWHPAPAPVPVVSRPSSAAHQVVRIAPVKVLLARTPVFPANTISTTLSELPVIPTDLSPAVRRQIRASLGCLKSEA